MMEGIDLNFVAPDACILNVKLSTSNAFKKWA